MDEQKVDIQMKTTRTTTIFGHKNDYCALTVCNVWAGVAGI